VIQNDIQNKMSQAIVTEGVELVEVTATAPEEQSPLFQNSSNQERTAEQIAADKQKVLAALARENEWAAKIRNNILLSKHRNISNNGSSPCF
jgi:hypothetical protein